MGMQQNFIYQPDYYREPHPEWMEPPSPPQGYWFVPQGFFLPYMPMYFQPMYATTYYPLPGRHYVFTAGGMPSPIFIQPIPVVEKNEWHNQADSKTPESLDVTNGDLDWMIPRKKTFGKAATDAPLSVKVSDHRVYQMLLQYIPSRDLLKNLGYPMGTPSNTTVFKQSSDRLLQKAHKDERTCSRCAASFNASPSNYSEESCCYHWGKYVVDKNYGISMTCCKKKTPTPGCTVSKMHVWCGWEYGMNTYTGFMRTTMGRSSRPRVFALDCEMCYTKAGMEVIRVTLVGLNGDVVYDTLVNPKAEVIDYNTEYSGISEEDFKNRKAKSFYNTRKELMDLIANDTILIGHGLENDLRVLKILHFYVIDTAIIFPHQSGMPCRRSLRSLARDILGIKIQRGTGTTGHDSKEDARVCLELVLHKIMDDHNVILKY